jgi:hypothetical protein
VQRPRARVGVDRHYPRGFPAGANRGILAGMSWHRTPTDDAWKQAHLAMVEGLGKHSVWGFERENPKLSTLNKWQRALVAAGVEFIEPADGKGAGVRMKRDERGKLQDATAAAERRVRAKH